MNESHEDRQLRDRFAHLRHEEAASAPAFARSLAGARQKQSARDRRRRWSYAAIAVPLTAAAALALWLARSPDPERTPSAVDVALSEPAETLLGTWEMPTDYLLEGPGTDLLGSVPELGEGDTYDLDLGDPIDPRADAGARRYT